MILKYKEDNKMANCVELATLILKGNSIKYTAEVYQMTRGQVNHQLRYVLPTIDKDLHKEVVNVFRDRSKLKPGEIAKKKKYEGNNKNRRMDMVNRRYLDSIKATYQKIHEVNTMFSRISLGDTLQVAEKQKCEKSNIVVNYKRIS